MSASSESRDEAWPHLSVLSNEVSDVLGLEEGLCVVDGTVGAGGHAVDLAARIGEQGTIIGIDCDPRAIEIAAMRLRRVPPRVELVHGSYRDLGSILDRLGIAEVDRVLLDLGYSSMQIDDPGRGLSFRETGPLDMRFNPDDGTTAHDLLRHSSEVDLATMFREFGEERHARRIARTLVQAREQRSLPSSTTELAELVARAVPPAARHGRIHPATRVFQALRIAVNRELDSLEEGLKVAQGRLRETGRLAAISFHSLEDRIVKRFMKEHMQPLLKKPITPTDAERRSNPRSRSAKLRVAVPRAAASDSRASDQRGAR